MWELLCVNTMLLLQQLILVHITIKYTEVIFTFFLTKPFNFPTLAPTTNSTANKSTLDTPRATTHHGISNVTYLCCILCTQKHDKYLFCRFRILYTAAIFIHLMGSNIKISYSILRQWDHQLFQLHPKWCPSGTFFSEPLVLRLIS